MNIREPGARRRPKVDLTRSIPQAREAVHALVCVQSGPVDHHEIAGRNLYLEAGRTKDEKKFGKGRGWRGAYEKTKALRTKS